MNKIESHPMRQQITDAILAGKTLRSIGATIDPPLHHATIARYRVKILGRATRNMRGVNADSIALQRLADAHDVGPNGLESFKETQRTEMQNSLRTREEQISRWISNAEIPDEEGQLRHGALSSHVGKILTSIELRAKLSGLLSDGTQVQLNNICVIGTVSTETPSEASQTIDIGSVRARR